MTLVSYVKYLAAVMHYFWLSKKYKAMDTTHTGLEEKHWMQQQVVRLQNMSKKKTRKSSLIPATRGNHEVKMDKSTQKKSFFLLNLRSRIINLMFVFYTLIIVSKIKTTV